MFSAVICEIHFNDGDIIQGKKKTLKIGAIPTKHLPKQTSLTKVTSSRKEPTIRVKLPQKMRYHNVADLFKASQGLSESVKSIVV